jgi:hypothetical protein
MQKNDCQLNCRQCPGRSFDLVPVMKSNFGPARFMAICHAKEVILHPEFPDDGLQESLLFINKSNIRTVQFNPVDNCPHLEEQRSSGLIPWATSTIDFLNHKNIER